MTDLDARVAALMALANKSWSQREFEQAIRAELQKPALHEPVTDAEVYSALEVYSADDYMARSGMRKALESFLQGRAKSAVQANAVAMELVGVIQKRMKNGEESTKPELHTAFKELPPGTLLYAAPLVPARAQEEITDAERYQFASKHFVLAGGGAFGWNIAPATKEEWDMYLNKAIRASKGEKT